MAFPTAFIPRGSNVSLCHLNSWFWRQTGSGQAAAATLLGRHVGRGQEGTAALTLPPAASWQTRYVTSTPGVDVALGGPSCNARSVTVFHARGGFLCCFSQFLSWHLRVYQFLSHQRGKSWVMHQILWEIKPSHGQLMGTQLLPALSLALSGPPRRHICSGLPAGHSQHLSPAFTSVLAWLFLSA